MSNQLQLLFFNYQTCISKMFQVILLVFREMTNSSFAVYTPNRGCWLSKSTYYTQQNKECYYCSDAFLFLNKY
uniref:Uncharacterized protein n=1 Tax=Octopus bimaculoides TaxID=37653 RepID=A0A0L8FR58_OCTBM